MKTAKEYLLKRDHLLYNILQPYPKEGFIHIFIDSQIQWNKKTWCSIMSSKHRQASADWIFTNLRKHCRNRCRSQSLHCTAVFIAVLFILVWFDSHINPLLFIIFFSFSPFWTLFDLNRLRAGSERIANVRVNYWILCCSVLLCRDGVHLHRRIWQNQGQSALCWSSASFCWW